MTITYKAATPGAGQYYARLILSDIKEENGDPVKVKNYLEISLRSPTPIKDVNSEIQFDKWDKKFNIVIKNCDEISKNEYQIDFVISEENKQPFTLEYGNNIELALNSPLGDPNLAGDLNKYIKSIIITADAHPATDGSVNIICPPLPENRLNGKSVELDFLIGTTTKPVVVKLGETFDRRFLAGNYHITAHTLISDDHNIIVPVFVKPDNINVEVNKTHTINLSFAPMERYSSVEFSVSGIDALATETLFVTLKPANGDPQSFSTHLDEITTIYKLPATGKLDVIIKLVNLNNKEYSFTIPPLTLENKNLKVDINKTHVAIKETASDDLEKVTIVLESDKNIASKAMEVRLVSVNYNYNKLVEIQGKIDQAFPVKIKPGTYKVIANNFIDNKTVYVVDAPAECTVKSGDNQIKIKIKTSTNLVVRGFDANKLTFGGCATLEPDNHMFFLAAKTHSIFKYAGEGGDGNPTKILEKDYATENTIALARKLETVFKETENVTHSVLPVMISYTLQLSGGNNAELVDEERLKNCFANFILTLAIMMKHKDETHPVPGGIIVNPDMLGHCLQHAKQLPATSSVKFKKPLQEALKAREQLIKQIPGISAVPTVPQELTEDIKGYIQAVNWLMSVLAPAVTFGWQINLWGIDEGGSQWIYGAPAKPGTPPLTAKVAAKKIADFVREMQVYSGKYVPDFLAIDRYEADDLTTRSYSNSYCYGPHQWATYFDFCAAISAELQLPVMPWQIPASRTPLHKDKVKANFDDQHWGTAANYILGDPELGSQVENIHPTVRNFSFSQHSAQAIATLVGDTPGQMYQHGGGFDVSQPAYRDFPLRGIFHVQLGGGSTLGMVPPTGGREADPSWSNQKLAEYAEHPVEFKDSLQKK